MEKTYWVLSPPGTVSIVFWFVPDAIVPVSSLSSSPLLLGFTRLLILPLRLLVLEICVEFLPEFESEELKPLNESYQSHVRTESMP